MLCIPNAVVGNQQTESMMAGDILTEPLPIRAGPDWGRIDRPGLGIEVDEAKLQEAQARYLREGQYVPYRLKTAPSA